MHVSRGHDDRTQRSPATLGRGRAKETARRYLRAAASTGWRPDGGAVSDEQVRDVLLALHPAGGRPHGDSWTRCGEQRETIRRWLNQRLRLSKIRKLLARQGVVIPYPTLHRFAVLELQFGRTAT